MGHDVCCVDIAEDRVRELEAGRIPIYESGLDELIAANRADGRIRFSCDSTSAVAGGAKMSWRSSSVSSSRRMGSVIYKSRSSSMTVGTPVWMGALKTSLSTHRKRSAPRRVSSATPSR
ncbi:hypothetical protein KX729_28740 [Rhizobium sp. XQZ8]|nr:hypothetical protein [Rhizobium populisoli]